MLAVLKGCYQSVLTVVTGYEILENVEDFIESFDIALKTFESAHMSTRSSNLTLRKSLLKVGRISFS